MATQLNFLKTEKKILLKLQNNIKKHLMLIKKNPKVIDTIKLTIKEFNKNYKGLCKIEIDSDGFELKNFDSLDVANFISLLTTHLEKKIKKNLH